MVASAGEDCKISLWMKNGQTVGVVPQPLAESDDNIDVSDQEHLSVHENRYWRVNFCRSNCMLGESFCRKAKSLIVSVFVAGIDFGNLFQQ